MNIETDKGLLDGAELASDRSVGDRSDERGSELYDERRSKDTVRTASAATPCVNLLISHLASIFSLSSPTLSFLILSIFSTLCSHGFPRRLFYSLTLILQDWTRQMRQYIYNLSLIT